MKDQDCWQSFKLNELGFVGRGRSRHRPRNDPSLYGGPYPFVQTGDIKAANFRLREYSQTYNEKGLSQSKLWDPGTLCITIAANIAETAILDIQACFPDSVVGFIPHPDRADVRFIKYYIDTIKLNMRNVSKGTTQDNLSLDKLLQFDFQVPPLSTQRKIADILSAYDDLIENNTRRIAILEEMAQRLYQEWFVHFRYPGHENVPLVDSELGPIPEGWEVKRLGDVATIVMGQSPKSEFYNLGGNGLPFHQGVTDFGPRFPNNRVYCTVVNRIAEPGDILFSVRAPVGRINLSTDRIVIGRGLAAIRAHAISQQFLFQQLNATFHEEDMIGGGSIFKSVTRSEVLGVEILVPDDERLQHSATLFQPLFAELELLYRTTRLLRSYRDLLIPNLIAGG